MATIKYEEINSLSSESGIIATLLHHPEYIYTSEHLKPNHFTDKDNQCIYTAIQLINEREIGRVDAYNIIEILNSTDATKKFAERLSLDSLNELIDMSELLARHTIEEYLVLVKNVIDAAFRRDVLDGLDECTDLCLKGTEEDIRKHIYEVIDSVMVEYSTSENIPEMSEEVDRLWEEIVAHQNGKEVGAPFKITALNDYVTITPQELVVVAAPAKGAKSMFMMNEAVDLLKRGKSVMYIDSELSSRMFLCRMISHLTGIEFNRIRSGNYDAFEEKKIKAQIAWIKRQRLTHLYMPIFDQDSIYTAVKKIMHKYNPLDVLIVDYLKPTNSSYEAYSTYAELGKLSDMIKNDLCGALGIAGLAAAQLTSGNKLADSAKIARNASTIVLMVDKTPEEIEVDGAECGNKKLIVAQNRNGMQHAPGDYIDVNFIGNICTITDAKQHVAESPY